MFRCQLKTSHLSVMILLKPCRRSFHRSLPPPTSAHAPPFDAVLVDKAIAVLKRHHLVHLDSLSSQFTPQSASNVLLRSQSDKHVCLKFINWARRRPFFDLQCKCLSVHILTRFKLYKTAQSLTEDMAVNDDDEMGNVVFAGLKDSYHSCNSSSAVFDLVIKSYSSLKMIDRALNVLNLAKFHGYMPSILSYNSILDAIIRVASRGYIELAKQLYDDMRKKGLSPNVFTYNILIRGFCGNKELEKGLSFFDEMERNGCLPNVVTFNTIIDAYCKLGKVEQTFNLLKLMWEKNLEPNVITYNVIINGLCREDRIKEANEVFEEMRNKGLVPDEVTYNTLVHGYCKVGDFHQALILHSEMMRNGLCPNVVTYTALIRSMCKEKNMRRAMEFFDQMRNRGVWPNERTYTTLIDGFSKQGLLHEAYEVLNEMIARGLLPTIVTYNALINGHCLMGQVEDALRVMEDMIHKGISPDVVSYSTVIFGFCKSRDLDKAFQMKEEMVKRGVQPDAITYSSLIQGFCEQRRLIEGCELFREMLRIGLLPDECTYTSLINAYFVEGDIRNALCLHDEMISKGFFPDVVTYSVLINGLNKQARTREAKQLLFRLFYEQSVPADVTYDFLIESCGSVEFKSAVALIKGFCMKGLMSEAEHVLELMLQKNHRPDAAVYNVLVHGHCRVGNGCKALDLYKKMLHNGFSPHMVTVIALMRELSRVEMDEELGEVIHNTVSSCRLTDAELAKSLVQVNYKEGNLDAVFDVLSQMAKDGLLPNSGTTAYAWG